MNEVLEWIINNIGIDLGIIVSFLGALISFIYLIRNRSASIFAKFFLRDVMQNNNKSEIKEYRNLIRKYVPHMLRKIDQEQSVDYNDFRKLINGTFFTVIVGDAGVGKTTLLYNLAYFYKSENKKKIQSFSDYSIKYIRIRGATDLEQIERIVNNANPNSTLIIDSFDELSCLYHRTADDVFFELINILDKNATGKVKRVILSTRREVFSNGIDSITNIKFGDEAIQNIWEIQPFSTKQSKQYINRFFRGKAKRIVRSKLLKSLSDNPDSVFKYPFILKFADDIIDMHEELKQIDLYDAVSSIIYKSLAREYKIYKRQFLAVDAEPVDEKKYISQGLSFLSLAAKTMMGCNVGDVRDFLKKNEFQKIISANGDSAYTLDQEMISTTRRILKLFNGTFVFLHSMIFEFFIARVLLDDDYNRDQRRTYIDTLVKSRNLIPVFYGKAAVTKCGDVLECSEISDKFAFDVRKIDSIHYSSHTGCVKVEDVVNLFPYLTGISIDNTILFDQEELDMFFYHRQLYLNEREYVDLNCLDCFHYETIYFINLSKSNVVHIEKLKSCESLLAIIIPIRTQEEFDVLTGLRSPREHSPHVYIESIPANSVELINRIYIWQFERNKIEFSIHNRLISHMPIDFDLIIAPDFEISVFQSLDVDMQGKIIMVGAICNRPLFIDYLTKDDHNSIHSNIDLVRRASFSRVDYKIKAQNRTIKSHLDLLYHYLNRFVLIDTGVFCDSSDATEKIKNNYESALRIINLAKLDSHFSAFEKYERKFFSFYKGYLLFLVNKYRDAKETFLSFIDYFDSFRLKCKEHGIDDSVFDEEHVVYTARLKHLALVHSLLSICFYELKDKDEAKKHAELAHHLFGINKFSEFSGHIEYEGVSLDISKVMSTNLQRRIEDYETLIFSSDE